MRSRADLKGLGVVVTRPEGRAETLCRLIESEGGHAIRFPALEISDVQDPRPGLDAIRRLHEFHLAVFVSINAVEKGVKRVLSVRAWPPGLNVAAVGQGTANALQRLGFHNVIHPSVRFDSEGLLALPALRAGNVAGREVVIFRGQGGRGLLARALEERGAHVTYAEVYRRTVPEVEESRIAALVDDCDVGAVVVTSVEGLRNLKGMLGAGGARWLESKTLVLASGRMTEVARELGIGSPVIVAERADDEALLVAIKRWRQAG